MRGAWSSEEEEAPLGACPLASPQTRPAFWDAGWSSGGHKAQLHKDGNLALEAFLGQEKLREWVGLTAGRCTHSCRLRPNTSLPAPATASQGPAALRLGQATQHGVRAQCQAGSCSAADQLCDSTWLGSLVR